MGGWLEVHWFDLVQSAGIVASLIFTLWASLTLKEKPIVNLGAYNFPWHDYMIGAIGHIVLLLVGYLASFLFHGAGASMEQLTLWGWLRRNSAAVSLVATPPERAM